MLKKVCVMASGLILSLLIMLFNTFPLSQDFGIPYEFYLHNNSSNALIVNANDFSFNNLLNVRGGSFIIENKEQLEDILSSIHAKELFRENTPYGVSVYGFSNKIKLRKIINGQIVNFQIYIHAEKIVLGVPLIYGSY